MKIRGEPSRTVYDGESTTEFPLGVTFFLSRPLINLNLFLGFLESKEPNSVEAFTQALVKHLKLLTLDTNSTADFEYESQYISKYPELEEITKQVTLGMLNYSKNEKDIREEGNKILFRDYIRSYVPTNNRMIAALIDVIDRDVALTLFKEYVDYRTNFFNESLIPKFESLDQLYELISNQETGAQSAVNAVLEGGMVVAKTTRCMWQEIQSEYGDMEIAYVNSCYFDFHAVTLWNDNFELTRTKTCMQDGFCDFCWHDKRIDKTMEHPSDEFWDNLK
ncbi:MAG: L-2-amino-thiazoline-4-carboxylic acid hydrolase [Candidatus Thorarchaeota archaeon]|jgi:hypothetical protein